MPKPVSVLMRRVDVNGAPVGDARAVVTEDGRAVLLHRPHGVPTAIATMVGADWEMQKTGVLVITDGTNSWSGQRDTRCGSCNGRYELRTLNPKPFLPEPAPAPEPAPLPGDTFSDTY